MSHAALPSIEEATLDEEFDSLQISDHSLSDGGTLPSLSGSSDGQIDETVTRAVSANVGGIAEDGSTAPAMSSPQHSTMATRAVSADVGEIAEDSSTAPAMSSPEQSTIAMKSRKYSKAHLARERRTSNPPEMAVPIALVRFSSREVPEHTIVDGWARYDGSTSPPALFDSDVKETLDKETEVLNELGLGWGEEIGGKASSSKIFGTGTLTHLDVFRPDRQLDISARIVHHWVKQDDKTTNTKIDANRDTDPYWWREKLTFQDNETAILTWSSEGMDVYRWTKEAPKGKILDEYARAFQQHHLPTQLDSKMIFATKRGDHQYSFYAELNPLPAWTKPQVSDPDRPRWISGPAMSLRKSEEMTKEDFAFERSNFRLVAREWASFAGEPSAV